MVEKGPLPVALRAAAATAEAAAAAELGCCCCCCCLWLGGLAEERSSAAPPASRSCLRLRRCGSSSSSPSEPSPSLTLWCQSHIWFVRGLPTSNRLRVSLIHISTAFHPHLLSLIQTSSDTPTGALTHSLQKRCCSPVLRRLNCCAREARLMFCWASKPFAVLAT